MAWNRPTRGYSSVPDVIVATIVVLLCIFGDPSHHPSASSAHVDAFIPISCEHQHRRRLRYTKQRQSILQTATEEAQVTLTDSSEDVRDNPANSILTTAVLKIAYDGTHFRGWTGGKHPFIANHHNTTNQTNKTNSSRGGNNKHNPKRQSRRSRTLQRKGGGYGKNSNKVRTVEQTIRVVLAKVYGNVNPNQIVMDSCSRTDAGVHATHLVAQFYCYSTNISNDMEVTSSPMQWNQMRPNSTNDSSNFLPLPFASSLSKLVFVLNRMLPPDVRVMAASPAPFVPESTPMRSLPDTDGDDEIYEQSTSTSRAYQAFHPTLHVRSKTYIYQFAIGPVHDPIRSQYVWHLDGSSGRAVGMNGSRFCLERAVLASKLFVIGGCTSQPRDFAAFKSSFRGNERGRVQSTTCTMWRCDILQEEKELLPSWERKRINQVNAKNTKYGSRLGDGGISFRPVDNFMSDSSNAINGLMESPQSFSVVITGDRFLYKMVRNIVGTIVAVGCGHLEVNDVQMALHTGKWGDNIGAVEEEESKSSDDFTSSHVKSNSTRIIRRICAPARGLSLHEVEYPPAIEFRWQTG